MLAGVLAGLAEYFNQDVVLFRLLAVAVVVVTGIFPGAFLYLVAWIMMPLEESARTTTHVDYEVKE